MTSAYFKSRAKAVMQGCMGTLIGAYVIYSILLSAGAYIPVIGSLLLVGPLGYGLTSMFYRNSRGESVEIGQLFWGFSKCFGDAFLAGLLQGIFIVLWSLLFVIPGIIKGFSYSMTYYIMVREPGISASDAIKRSQEMMNGNKMNLFGLYLSFIPWCLLGIVTCGLGFIYVLPYMEATVIEFYNSIYEQRGGSFLDGEIKYM